MKNLFKIVLSSLYLLAITNIVSAQTNSNIWRVSSKVRTFPNGQKFLYEYTYDKTGNIQTVKYYSASGVLTTTTNNFQFNTKGKPTAYVVNWNRENASAKVTLSYNNNGQLTQLQKLLNNGDKTTYTYRYSSGKITIVEQLPNSYTTTSNSTLSYYTDNGDYAVSNTDAAAKTITTIITVKQNPVPAPENEPTVFFGGYEAPAFLGTSTNANDPTITFTKNENGLITTRTITKQNGVLTNTYQYIHLKTPIVETPSNVTNIKTNINCIQGKQIVERVLKAQEGVTNATVDINTGMLALDYSSDGTPYTQITKLINDEGFDADKTTSTQPNKNPCATPTFEYVQKTGKNIFDARKGFATTPIKFVPFVITPDAAKKGFKLDSVYKWVAPDGKQKVATGAQILQQVNEMEAELNARGRTLRKKNAFAALSYKLVNPNALLKVPPVVPKKLTTAMLNTGAGKVFNKIPIITTKHNTIPNVTGMLANIINSDVGVYFGRISNTSGEFQGNISTTSFVDNSKCVKQCPIDITISMDAVKIKSLNITNTIVEISANPNRLPNDNEVPLATGNFNFKNPIRTKYGSENMIVSGDAPPSFHTLYYFSVTLNDLSKLGIAEVKPKNFYVYIKFYNNKGELLSYSTYNTAILQNKIDAPIFIAQQKEVKAQFDDAFTDPTGLFGMYYKSSNISATYKTDRDDATLVVSENSEVNGQVEIGAQYYNFWYLLDDAQPKYERKSFVAANFTSKYTNKYTEGRPSIRIPGYRSNEMNNYAGYELNYSIYDGKKNKTYNKASNSTEAASVEYNIFDERFFIGPVPCRIKVDVSGNASFTRIATMDTLTDGKVSMATTVTPHLDLTLKGEGGVDAAIAYAKIVANVKVIEVDLPITAIASREADLKADLKITALSGQIYFTAGLCIPIPWFDDICTDFRVDIFNWTGPNKTYTLVK
ncbi:heavy-metal-associated domain-containing protein [Ferruginibacter yonginensis]|uniref:Heavy-metal-associated domain-containing protein n=1 Tax=Ferruginibacter yonginensis TaxID=1310416 RepID=A0ABV8QTN0_9BACT